MNLTGITTDGNRFFVEGDSTAHFTLQAALVCREKMLVKTQTTPAPTSEESLATQREKRAAYWAARQQAQPLPRTTIASPRDRGDKRDSGCRSQKRVPSITVAMQASSWTLEGGDEYLSPSVATDNHKIIRQWGK